jgi:hypothetical protein
MHACIHTITYNYIHTYIHAYIHTYIQLYKYIQLHTITYNYIQLHTYIHNIKDEGFPALSGYLGGKCTMAAASFPAIDVGKTQAAEEGQDFSKATDNKELHL